MNKKNFEERIKSKKVGISVIGMGYVGLNIACLFARNGFNVYGFDIDKEKISKLLKNINPFQEEQWLSPYISRVNFSNDIKSALKDADIIFIAVQTPFKNDQTCFDYLVSALRNVSRNLSKGKILVIESTIPPGTTEGYLREIIENENRLTAGEDFGLVFSPERIDPGNKRNMIWNIPKIVGGIDPRSTEIVSFLYSQVIEKVIPVSNPTTAELVKVMENTQRDVNIALTNLFAKAADKLGVDIEEALDGAATKWNFVRLRPSCGVGGECIGDASKMLIETMHKICVDSSLIKESRKINDSMPFFVIDKLKEISKEIGKSMRNLKILILGLAYKANSSDLRNSPSLRIIEGLKEIGCRTILVYDSLVETSLPNIQQIRSLREAIRNVDCVIVGTDHDEIKNINLSLFYENQVHSMIDGRNCFNRNKIKNLGIIYKGIGR